MNQRVTSIMKNFQGHGEVKGKHSFETNIDNLNHAIITIIFLQSINLNRKHLRNYSIAKFNNTRIILILDTKNYVTYPDKSNLRKQFINYNKLENINELLKQYIPVEKKVIEYQTIKRKIQVPVTEEVIDYVPITTQETVEISPPRIQVQKETIPIIQQHVSFAQQRPQNIHPVPVSIRQPSPIVKQSPRLITQTIPSPPRIQTGQFYQQNLPNWLPQQRQVQNQPPPQFLHQYPQIQPQLQPQHQPQLQPQFQSIHQQLPPQIPIAAPQLPQQQFIHHPIPQQLLQTSTPIPQPYQIPYEFQLPPPVPIPQLPQQFIQQPPQHVQPQYSQSNIIPNDPQYRPPTRPEDYQSDNVHIHIPNRQRDRNDRPDNQIHERHDNRHYINQNQQPSFAESYPVQYDFQDDPYGEQRIQERQQFDPRQQNQQNQRNPREDRDAQDDIQDTYKYNSNASNYTAQRNVYMPDYNRIPQNRELSRGVYSDRQPQYTQRTRKQQQDEYFRDKIFN
ncbi:hypothetical protein pb186bvf_012202 [Paramecium bursaria]